jgi:hypothetical protein
MSGLPIRNIRRGNAMKIMSLALLLMASMAFVLVGCSDNSAPLVAPTDQSAQTPAPLAKAVIHYFSGKEINPTYLGPPVVGEGGGGQKLILTEMLVQAYWVAPDPPATGDPRVIGPVRVSGHGTLDASTGEGPVKGKFTLEPVGGGVWEGTWEGYRKMTQTGPPEWTWTNPLKLVAKGTGGDIDGMQLFAEDVIITHDPQGSTYIGIVSGYYKEH